MRMLTHAAARLGLFVFMIVGVHSEGAAQPMTLDSGATGRINLQSLNLSAAQFEAGTKEAGSVTISGDLALPEGTGQVPTVILFHGSAGITASERGWASRLPAIGVATFMVDSFTPRKITSPPSEEQLSRAGQVIDAYRAIELLVTHPRIDRERIALMGFSRGGGQTLLAAIPRLRDAYVSRGIGFAAYLAFYPTLRPTARLLASGVPDRPVRIFHGSDDDSEPIATVREYVARVQRDGADVQLFEFNGAHHSFDDPSIGRPRRTPRGFTVGYNASAHRQAIQEVEQFLVSVFRLKR
jgi:dienelactone hydrolase